MKHGNNHLNTADRSHIEFHPKYTHFAVNKKGLLPPAERDYFADNGLLREAEQYNTGFNLNARTEETVRWTAQCKVSLKISN